MNIRTLSLLATPAIATLLTSACTSSSDEDPSPLEVLISAPTTASMLSVTSGKIADVGGCLGVGDAVVVWPPGTKVLGRSPLEISIPNTGKYTVGDHIELGGGLIHEPPHDATDKPVEVDGKPIPASCAEHLVFLAGPDIEAK